MIHFWWPTPSSFRSLVAFSAFFALASPARAETCEGGHAEGAPCDGHACAGDCCPKVDPTALLQIWGTAFDQDQDPQADPAAYGDPEDDPGFRVRRARIGLEGCLGHGFGFDVTFGASSPYDTWKVANEDIGLVDAKASWHRQGFQVSVGQQKVPVSREQMISASDLVFTDRAVSTEYLVPDRETGLVAEWAGFGAHVYGGAFNASGSFLGNESQGLLLAGRGEWSTAPDQAFATWGKVDSVVIAAGADTFFDNDLSTTTFAFGGDLLFRIAGLSVLAEGRMATLKPVNTDVMAPDVMEQTDRMGAMAQVGYSVWQLEPAVQVSMYDDNKDADDNGDVMLLQGGTTWHMADDMARLGAGYIHRTEMGGVSMANDTIRIWTQLKY